MTENKVVVTQAQFLVGLLELKKGLAVILDIAKEGIIKGSSPNDPVPQEWLDKYQYHVTQATAQVCGSGLSHKESSEFVHKLAGDLITSVLENVLTRMERGK